jgi:hypothetical protein
MENYHKRAKTSKPKFEDDSQDANFSSNSKKQQKQTTQQHNRPQQHGVMVITPNGKIRTYVSRALEVLTEADAPSEAAAAVESGTASNTKDGAGAPSQVMFSSTGH